jgi:hypothetical protein
MMSRVRAASIRAPSCAPATVRSESEFARAIDQLHILAALGLPVPTSRAGVPLTERVSTLFETRESVQEGRGHLYDDLFRAREAMDGASGNSLSDTERSVVVHGAGGRRLPALRR